MKSVPIQDVCALVARQLGVREVAADDDLMSDLGAESADVANLIAAVEDRYDVRVDEDALADLRTVADLHRLAQGGGRP